MFGGPPSFHLSLSQAAKLTPKHSFITSFHRKMTVSLYVASCLNLSPFPASKFLPTHLLLCPYAILISTEYCHPSSVFAFLLLHTHACQCGPVWVWVWPGRWMATVSLYQSPQIWHCLHCFFTNSSQLLWVILLSSS